MENSNQTKWGRVSAGCPEGEAMSKQNILGESDCMKWYVAFVVTGKECIVAEEIENELICSQSDIQYQIVLFKLVVFERYSGGRVEKREKTMFPGYVFIHTNNIERLYRLVSDNKNIIKFLKTEDYFTPVEDNEMERLLALSDENNTIGESEIFIENETVRVFQGALVNYTGKIYKIDRRKQRVKVAFEIDEKMVFMSLPVTILEKVNPEKSKNTINFAKHKCL